VNERKKERKTDRQKERRKERKNVDTEGTTRKKEEWKRNEYRREKQGKSK
jgi:hypothetical protein